MRALILGDRKRYEKYYPGTDFADTVEKLYYDISIPLDCISSEGKSAEFLAVDAIGKVPAELIAEMPNLKIIHSEGVGYDKIDCAAAAERGIYVCNNKGVNANAVAEQTILLMLGLLRKVIPGNQAVRNGKQIMLKEQMMVQGITELGECTVGLIGFGDIARAVARFLMPYGCRVLYNARSRKSEAVETEYNVIWAEIDEIKAECNIVSIHVPVTKETKGMVDESFLRKMKAESFLINTARGEIVDNNSLRRALEAGWIAGAGLDTLAPEPVEKDNILLQANDEVQARIIYSPHIGGVTTATFRKAHGNIWKAFEAVSENERPDNVVNNI